MSMKKKVLIGTGIVVGLFIVSNMWSKNRADIHSAITKEDSSDVVTSTSDPLPQKQNEEPKKPEIVVDAVSLYKEFETNEASADHKYSGELIQVNGTISDIHKEIHGVYSVNLSTGDEYGISHIVCELEPNNSTLKNLSKGQNVAIVGYLDGNGLTGNNVNFKDGCKVFE